MKQICTHEWFKYPVPHATKTDLFDENRVVIKYIMQQEQGHK